MKPSFLLVGCVLVAGAAWNLSLFRVTGPTLRAVPSQVAVKGARPGDSVSSTWSEFEGRTQCAPGRKGIIAPVPLHPVVDVLVQPGDQVKKDQPLVKLDDDEPQADVRAKQAALESAQASAREALRYLKAAERVYHEGAFSEAALHLARVARLKAEADERAAKAALDASKAELEHYVITAPIAGIICWLDVYPGMVSRPGTTVWGEILDLSEIDVWCEVTPEQADGVTVGQAAEVRTKGKDSSWVAARIVFVSISADKQSGRVPVVVRVSNPKGRLRCEVPVTVRWKTGSTDG